MAMGRKPAPDCQKPVDERHPGIALGSINLAKFREKSFQLQKLQVPFFKDFLGSPPSIIVKTPTRFDP